MPPESNTRSQNTLGKFIFVSRWLQAPLSFGLIVAQAVYVTTFPWNSFIGTDE